MDLKPKIKKDPKIKTAILTILLMSISLFAWLAVKRALYTAGVAFRIDNSAIFWQWFWLKIGWPVIGLAAFCSFLALYLIAVRSRIIAFIAGIILSGLFLFVFLTAEKTAMIVYGGLCVIFLGAMIAADGAIQREERQRVTFGAKPLARSGIAPLIPALILMLSAAYYFSPLPREVKTIAISDNIIENILKTAGEISEAPAKNFDAQNFVKDYIKKNMPESEGIIDDEAIREALKGIGGAENAALGSPPSLIKDIKSQVNRQIETLFSKYYKYIPAAFTASFLLTVKFLSAEFSWFVVLITAFLIKICFALGLFEKEIEVVEKENLVF